MTFNTETVKEPTREEQLRLLQEQVNEVFAEAISNQTKLECLLFKFG